VTDRELLEAAARAAGIMGAYNDEYRSFWIAGYLRGDEDGARAARNCLGLAHGRIWWDPLIDDGDALRLAVKLSLFDGLERAASATAAEFDYDMDPYTATRRAIVRAASRARRSVVY
jgi:hypothetical protein